MDVQCAWCKRQKYDSPDVEYWYWPVNDEPMGIISHGMCPDCAAKIKKENKIAMATK
jgi:hypothetical protein